MFINRTRLVNDRIEKKLLNASQLAVPVTNPIMTCLFGCVVPVEVLRLAGNIVINPGIKRPRPAN